MGSDSVARVEVSQTHQEGDTKLNAGELMLGDQFLWCSRVVTVVAVQALPHKVNLNPRWERYITARLPNGDRKRLHYYDDEQISVVSLGDDHARAYDPERQDPMSDRSDIIRYLTDAPFHAQVYSVAASRCVHPGAPCAECLKAAIESCTRLPWLAVGGGKTDAHE